MVSDYAWYVIQGRNLFYFSVPIIMASILIHPFAGFLFATISSLAITLLGLTVDIYPNIFTLTGFFSLAAVSWLITARIDRTHKALREREEELKESRKRFQSIVDSAKDAIITINSQGIIILLNRSAEKIFGYTSQEMLGKPITLIIPERFQKEHLEKFKEVAKTGEDPLFGGTQEFPALRKDGSEIPIEMTLSRYLLAGETYFTAILRDITERKRVEEERDEALSHFKTLFNITVDPMVIVDENGTVLETTMRAEDVTGYGREEIIGKTIMELEFLSVESRRVLISSLRKRVRGAEVSPYTIEMITGSGERKYFEVKAELIEYYGETAVMAAFRDIKERLYYEERLEAMHSYTAKLSSLNEIDEIYSTVLDTIEEAMRFNFAGIAVRVGDKIRYVEVVESSLPREWYIEYGRSVTGRAFETAESQLVNDVRFDPDYIPGDIEGAVHEVHSELAVPVKTRRGVTAVINIEIEEPDTFNVQDQKILEILSEHMAANIDRIRAREYERIYESRVSALHTHAVDLSDADNLEDVAELTVDTVKSVFGFNRISFLMVEDGRLVRLDGHPRDTIQELPLDGPGICVRAVNTGETQLVPDIRLDNDFLPGIKDETLKPSRSELAVPVKVGEDVAAVINVESPVTEEFDETDRRLMELLAESVSSAIERLNRMEELEELVAERTEELRNAYEELMELDRMKDQFVGMATHELRTPLVSIKGYVDYIQNGSAGDVPKRIEELLEVVQRNTRRLESLTDDLLDQQRIESGRLEIKPETIKLERVMDDILEEVEPLIKEKDLTLALEIPEALPPIYADQIRIGQVLINLVNNAIKFSPEGSEIRVDVEDAESGIRVRVQDEGIGLNPNDMRELFKPFPKIEKPDFYGGTGLGLSICKGIVELHGGEIWAESEGRGEGSTFIFTLPKNSK
ncbi:MAG: PAS domain S-box protein [Candidatus Bathyarchaeia archaeon]